MIPCLSIPADSIGETIGRARATKTDMGIKITLNDSAVLNSLNSLKGELMATLKDVQNEIAAMKSGIEKEKGEVAVLFGALKAQIKALQDQIAEGTLVTSADLDGVVTQIREAETAVDAISGTSDPAPTPAA